MRLLGMGGTDRKHHAWRPQVHRPCVHPLARQTPSRQAMPGARALQLAVQHPQVALALRHPPRLRHRLHQLVQRLGVQPRTLPHCLCCSCRAAHSSQQALPSPGAQTSCLS